MLTACTIIISIIAINFYLIFNHKHKKFVKDNWKIIRKHFQQENIHISLYEDHCELDYSKKNNQYHLNLSYKKIHEIYNSTKNGGIRSALNNLIKDNNI